MRGRYAMARSSLVARVGRLGGGDPVVALRRSEERERRRRNSRSRDNRPRWEAGSPPGPAGVRVRLPGGMAVGPVSPRRGLFRRRPRQGDLDLDLASRLPGVGPTLFCREKENLC